MNLEKMKRIADARTIEAKDGLIITRLLSDNYDVVDAVFIVMAANNWNKFMAVVDAAKDLVGKDNIGKTVDTSIDWTGDISAPFKSEALTRLVRALEELEQK